MLALGLALVALAAAKPCPAADANLKSLNKGDGRVSVTFRSQIDEELQVYWMTREGEEHDVGILENVQGAEWDKMAYYIEGRLPLRSVAPGGGGAKVHELRFEVAGDAFVVSEVSEPSSGISPRTSPYLPISRPSWSARFRSLLAAESLPVPPHISPHLEA